MTKTAGITLYGIPNCDTVKKARDWLTAHAFDYAFHNYKTDGIDRRHLDAWVKRAGWEIVLNRAGTTFRALSDDQKADITARKAVTLMLTQPSLIKRPVLERGDTLLLGFKPEIYAEALGA
ncbi:MAG: ArsC family reductase [Alphaproteobacteria bacterium]|nr:ArsC family reductase [Alphaproteobacteria bacterium]